jgi:hypothetical protein
MREKNKKTIFFNFLPYECEAVEEYLEAMAEKGWLLQSASGPFLKFKKVEPQKIKYTVDVFHKISEFDHKESDIALEYREYCQKAGWKYVCQKGKILIFYSEDFENTVPIHTDEEENYIVIILLVFLLSPLLNNQTFKFQNTTLAIAVAVLIPLVIFIFLRKFIFIHIINHVAKKN